MPSEYLNALKEGQVIEEYQIIRVLGAGGFGITYLAFDENLDKPVAIKEYLPNDLALRHGETEIRAKATDAEADFKWGLDQFMREAKTLAKFNHPNIIRINRFFEANGTGYIVMDYAEGQTLTEKIKEDGLFGEEQLKKLLLAIADGLKQAHSFGILHRDIKPGNIMLLDDDTPILIDFGSARQAIEVKSKSVTSIVTPGYAPIEQYDTNGKQGPWSDIYALGAVAYVALVGERPPDATGRIRVDNMTPLAQQKSKEMSQAFLKGIDWALAPQEESRPQNIESWVEAFTGAVPVPDEKKVRSSSEKSFIDDEKTILNKNRQTQNKVQKTPKQKPKRPKSDNTILWIGSIIIVAVVMMFSPSVRSLFISDGNVVLNSENSLLNGDDGINGSEPEALDEEEAWRKAIEINTIESYLGYLSSFPMGRYLSQANEKLTLLSQHNNNSKNLYATTVVNVRSWPSTNAAAVSTLAFGQRVTAKGKVVDMDWYSVGNDEAELLFVHSSLLQDEPLESLRQTDSEQDQEREKIKQRWRDAIQQRNR